MAEFTSASPGLALWTIYAGGRGRYLRPTPDGYLRCSQSLLAFEMIKEVIR